MTEETAIRIAEALESIEGDLRTGLLIAICFCVAFWIIGILK